MNKIRIEPDSKVKLLQAASVVLPRGLKKGFTVLELMVVITIAGIMATIAVPAFQDWMTHSAVNNATATVMSKLKQARNLAVAENRDVRVSLILNASPYPLSNNPSPAFIYDAPNDVPSYLSLLFPSPPPLTPISMPSYSPKSPEFIDLNQFSKRLVFTTNGTALVFKSSGMITGNATMKISQDTYYRCITTNAIGRSYIVKASSSAAIKAKCQGL